MTNSLLKKMRMEIVSTAHFASEGHIASALSILDLIWVLYDGAMIIKSREQEIIHDDRFILSKGHASLALYVVLANKGFITLNELATFCQYDSRLGGHPDCNKIPCVEASTGSLGHGLPIAVGIALGSRIQNIRNRIFCLIGDGECNEGTIWESALLAAHHQLSNLCCIVDFNHSTDRALDLGDIAAKFESFGWHVMTIDGHDHVVIRDALMHIPNKKPLIIIAETIKGYGIKGMENNPAWHHRIPSDDELKSIIEELK